MTTPASRPDAGKGRAAVRLVEEDVGSGGRDELRPPDILTITAYGQPRPKGSMRHVGHGRMVEQVTGSKPWREAVKAAALEALRLGPEDAQGMARRLAYPFGDAPLVVVIAYAVNKPASAPKRRVTWPVTRSSFDVDKVARNCLDALVDAGVMRDDAQVVSLWVRKVYVGEGCCALDRPGAVIRIKAVGGGIT